MKKILILPYRIDNQLKDLDYLPEGILEELIYLLSDSTGISTTPRSTSLYLNNNPIRLNEIKRRFNVDFLVEGNVKQHEKGYLISTRVFNTTNDELTLNTQTEFELNSWTQTLDKLVNEISLAIQGNPILNSPKKDNSQSREFYQKGLYHWNRYTHSEMLMAIAFFKRSIKENKNFALPYAAIADCYSIIGAMGYEPPVPAFKLAREFVSKTLSLNNKRSDSYVSAALVDIFHDRNFPQAKINLEQALSLNASSVGAHHVLAMYYIHLRDLAKAEKYAAITIKLEPLAVPHHAMMVRIQIYQKRFQLAMDYINGALNIDQHSFPLIELRGHTNLFLGNTELAIEDFKNCLKADNHNPLFMANLSLAYSKANFHDESRDVEQQLLSLDVKKNTGIFDYAMALIKLGQSNYKAFFSHITNAIDLVLGMLPGELICNPIFNVVREDKRFRAILSQFNLDQQKPISTKNRKPSNIVTVTSNTSETLTLDPQDISFIEASDNYCIVHWYESGVLKNKMLRLTLTNIGKQLASFDYIIHCHKSFIINSHQAISLSGNTKDAFFESPNLPIRIPISRSKLNDIKVLLKSLKA